MEMKGKRFLSLALALVMVACLMPVGSASAVTMTGGEVLYLKPNSNWLESSARFAAYFYGTGNAWADMTYLASGVYEVVVPEGSWTNVIFCRMNPSTTENDWSNKWNQSGDLAYDGTKNLCTINDGQWDCGTNVTWSSYTPVYTVVGQTGLCGGTEWNTTNTANDMTLEGNVYVKTFENIAAGTYEYKVVVDHGWNDNSWPSPSSNASLTTSYTASTVTVTFDPATKNISATVACAHGGTTTTVDTATCGEAGAKTVTCDDCQKEISSEASPATGNHSYENGTCTGCGGADPDYVAGGAQIGDTAYDTLAEALEKAKEGQTVELLKDAEIDSLILMNSISLDLKGCTLTVGHVAAYPGSTVIDSAGSGLLKVKKDRVMLQKENGYLPIWNGTDGYMLANCAQLKEQLASGNDTKTYTFLPYFSAEAYKLLAKSADITGVTMKVQVSWTGSNGKPASTAFTFSEDLIAAVSNSYKADTDNFGQAFSLELFDAGDKVLSFTVCFESETGVQLTCSANAAE